MTDWLERQAAALGVESLSTSDCETLLGIAGHAAHETGVRTNAPLLCYLLGVASGSGKSLDELVEIVKSTS